MRSALAICLSKYKLNFFSHAPPHPLFFDTPSNLRKFFFSLLSAVCAPSTGPRQEKSPGERRKSSPVTTVTGCAGRPRRGAKICLWEGRPATWATTTPPRSTQPPVSTARERERELCFDFFCRSAGGEKGACLPAGFAWGGAGSGPRASHPLGGRRSGAGRQAPRWAGASAAVCRRV